MYATGTIPFSCVINNSGLAWGLELKEHVTIKNSSLSNKCTIGEFSQITDSTLSGNVNIGWGTVINKSTLNGLYKGINVGNYTSIAPDVYMIDYNHDIERPTSHFMYKYFDFPNKWREVESKGPITIGNDVWIGRGCTILSGVDIGDGAVIAAGSVVNRSVPSNSVYGGIPAKHLSNRMPNISENMKDWWLVKPGNLSAKYKFSEFLKK